MNRLLSMLVLAVLMITVLTHSIPALLAQNDAPQSDVGSTPTPEEQENGSQEVSGSLYLPLIAGGQEGSNWEQNQQEPGLVCTIPLGKQGIHYEINPEAPPWGPSALVVGLDQTFWIADAAANRILQFDTHCNLGSIINLNGLATAPTDLAVTTESIWILDASSQEAALLKLDRQGSLISKYPLPDSLSTAAGLSGITLSPQGEPLIEQENGAEIHRMIDPTAASVVASANNYVLAEQSIQVSTGGLASDNPSTGYIRTGSTEVVVSVTNNLGGLHILGFAHDNSFYAVLEEVALRDTIVVDQRIHHYAVDGVLLDQARTPLQEQYTYVPHALTMDAAGNVYFLVTRPTGIEIQRLRFVTNLEPVIPPLVPATKIDDVPDMATPEPFVTPVATPQLLINSTPAMQTSLNRSGDSIQACTITRDTIMANAAAFINNSISLSETNINGVCSGRGKPRYLGGAGTYKSVPYDWGGKVSLDTFNSKMREGKQAGDINIASVEACSVGVDCSGFIARVWDMPSFQPWPEPNYPCCEYIGVSKLKQLYTTQLSSINELQRGDILANNANTHVTLFDSFGTNGFNSYEATTDWQADRVFKGFRDWTWVTNNQYKPYSLKSQYLCSGSQTPAAPSNLRATVLDSSRIQLNWNDNSNNESGFKLERCQGAGCTNFAQIATVAANATTYINTGLTAGTTYVYRLRATHSSGDSAYSNTASAKTTGGIPAAPSNLRATALDSSRIQLNWNDNSNNETGFTIYDGSTFVANVGANAVTYTATGLAPGSYHCYHLYAYNNSGSSVWTDWACAITLSSATGFNSQFNGSAPGWFADSGSWTVDAYYLTSAGLTAKWATAHQEKDYSNFDFETMVWRNGCNSCSSSVFFRGTPTPLDSFNRWYKGYLLTFNRDGYYALWSIRAGSSYAIQGWTFSNAIRRGSDWNVVRIKAVGSSIIIYFNGTWVWSGSNSDHSTGKVGLGMYQEGSNNQIWFDYAKLTPATAAAASTAEEINAEQQALNEAVAAQSNSSAAMTDMAHSLDNGATTSETLPNVEPPAVPGADVVNLPESAEVIPTPESVSQQIYLPLIQYPAKEQ